MNRCATCKHWTPFVSEYADKQLEDEDLAEAEEFGTRPRYVLIHRKQLGLCAKADGIQIDQTTLAIAEDGSDYIANFRTSAEFGCVMHEEKTT